MCTNKNVVLPVTYTGVKEIQLISLHFDLDSCTVQFNDNVSTFFVKASTILTMKVHSRENLKEYEFYYLLPLMYFVLIVTKEKSLL
jgi:hypothetical protein